MGVLRDCVLIVSSFLLGIQYAVCHRKKTADTVKRGLYRRNIFRPLGYCLLAIFAAVDFCMLYFAVFFVLLLLHLIR